MVSVGMNDGSSLNEHDYKMNLINDITLLPQAIL